MMNRVTRNLIWVGVSLCLLLLWGCANTPPSKFYILTPIPSSEQKPRGGVGDAALAIGIGPIELPGYLDRPHIVKRSSSHELHLGEFHKWAEPLKGNVTRVLAENLSVLLSTDQLYLFPWKRSAHFDYQVLVRITRFDTSSEGEAILNARWEIRGNDEIDGLAIRRSHFRTIVGGARYQDTVAAMSKNLEDLSRALATTIKSLNEKQPEI